MERLGPHSKSIAYPKNLQHRGYTAFSTVAAPAHQREHLVWQ